MCTGSAVVEHLVAHRRCGGLRCPGLGHRHRQLQLADETVLADPHVDGDRAGARSGARARRASSSAARAAPRAPASRTSPGRRWCGSASSRRHAARPCRRSRSRPRLPSGRRASSAGRCSRTGGTGRDRDPAPGSPPAARSTFTQSLPSGSLSARNGKRMYITRPSVHGVELEVVRIQPGVDAAPAERAGETLHELQERGQVERHLRLVDRGVEGTLAREVERPRQRRNRHVHGEVETAARRVRAPARRVGKRAERRRSRNGGRGPPPQPEATSARPPSRASSAAGTRRRAINPSIIGIRPITLEAHPRTPGLAPQRRSARAAEATTRRRETVRNGVLHRGDPRLREAAVGGVEHVPDRERMADGQDHLFRAGEQRLEHCRHPGCDSCAALASTRADRHRPASSRPSPCTRRAARPRSCRSGSRSIPGGRGEARRARRGRASSVSCVRTSSLATPRSIRSSASASRRRQRLFDATGRSGRRPAAGS